MKPALEPFGIDVIVDARPPRLDGAEQNVADRAVKPAAGRLRNLLRGAIGTYPGLPQSLARVDVPDARNMLLVEQERLDRRPTPVQHTHKGLRGKGLRERFHPAVGVPHLAGLQQPHATELADVGETQPPAVPKAQANVGVGVRFRDARRLNDQPPGHAQVHRQSPAGAELDHDELSTPADRVDPLAPQGLDERDAGRRDGNLGHADPGVHDRLADDRVREAACDRFDFRELGHRG